MESAASEINQSQNEIVAVIVHDLIKVGTLSVDERVDIFPVTATVQRLVDQLVSEYAKRSGKSHGRFMDDEDNYPIQKYIREYYTEHTKNFLELSQVMMKTLCAKAAGTAATGGHVFIAHIFHDELNYLIVAILTDELGAALTAGKDLTDSIHLDIKGFRFAGRIDMTNWKSGGERYLSFLKGRKQDRVSDYFKAFLGCDNSIVAAKETATLLTGLESFVVQQEMDEVAKNDFLTKAFHICSRLASDDEPIDIQEFANELWPSGPEQLVAVLSAPDLKLSEGFVPDKRTLRRLVKFSGKTQLWKIEFERTALNQGQIIFNDDETLTINNLPEELKDRLRKEFKQDEEDE
jgi:nucleoid-associated protein